MGPSDNSHGLQLALFLLLSSVAFITLTGSIRLTGCGDGNLTVVEKSDSIYLYCYFSADQSSSVHWTLNSDNGTTTRLATCYPPYNCTNFLSRSDLRIYVSSTRTDLQYNRIPRDFSGTVMCTETINSTKKSATCRLHFVRVQIGHSSSQNIFDGQENRSSSIYCYNSPFSPSAVTWTLTTETGQTLHLGTCSNVNSCESPYEPNITLYRYTAYTRADFQRHHRDRSGRISCSFRHNGVTEKDDGILNVYHPATVNNCNINIMKHNWSASMSCDITMMFSSAGIYDCRVYISFGVKLLSTINYGSHNYDRQSCSEALTSYTNSTDNKEYRKGRMVYSWNISSLPVQYRFFDMDTFAGFSSLRYFRMRDGIFNVRTPAIPVHNCTNIRYIPETGGTTCMCTSDDLGSPAGRLIWLLGDDVIIAGDYGHKQLVFPPDSMRRNVDRMVAMCQLDWIQPQQVTLPLNIAYGPENVQLLVNKQSDADDKLSIVLGCQVTEVNPMTPDMVEWEGPCQDQEGFTCTLDPRVTDVEGKSVTCHVTNAANNGHSTEATVIITGAHTGPVVADEMTDRIKWAAVGGGVVFGVALVIVLLVVLVKKCRSGCSCREPVYDSTQPAGADSSEGNVGDAHLYDLYNVDKNKGRNLPATPGTDHIYENPSFGGEAGHI